MSRKKLVVSGDSWTARKRWSYAKNVSPEYITWPKYLADMLDMNVINVGLAGKGNEFIYNHIVDKLSSVKNVGLTIVMWSGAKRCDFVGDRTIRIDPSITTPFVGHENQKTIYRYRPVFDAIIDANLVSTEYNFLKTLRWFNAFQNYCECNNIPYMQCSAFNVLDKNVISTIIDHPVFYKMNEEHFYGWPIFHQIGGFNMSDKLNEVDPEMKKLRISDEDNHPNVEGHKFIAKLLYDYYVKTYERNS